MNVAALSLLPLLLTSASGRVPAASSVVLALDSWWSDPKFVAAMGK